MASKRPITQCLRCTRHDRIHILPFRNLTTTTTSEPPPPPPPSSEDAPKQQSSTLNPFLVHTPRSERKLLTTQSQYPIGSRRRRAALATSSNIPFTQLPYQCFQEARKILLEDRREKIAEIEKMRDRIEKVQKEGLRKGEGESEREHRVRSMRGRIEDLKVLADINDPLVKKRFEDGLGDMNKPIYRSLANQSWRNYKRKVLLQRITQMNVIPDILPFIGPTVSTSLSFGRKKVPHGEIVESTLSERAPSMELQCFDKGERLVTIAVVNPDVPDVEKDGFGYRCHFLASNVRLSPTETGVDFASLHDESQVIIPWMAPYVQKGLQYQRHAIFILEQPSSPTEPPTPLDLTEIKKQARYTNRDGFKLRSFADRYRLRPVGVDLFRAVWDEGTAGVMERLGVSGGDVEFKRKRVEPLPYKRLKGERFT
ncbi:mitochondrial 54S ribosomal protein YmL35 [Vermiconidia calcicola]|uniref:Mitochondrial 54S ribosomal protein YmL35 n=1 Tax=Vermiconidia calcicola TaxID=1690605 RepID=A0ACC3MTJ4_9PEZI|nr:mitochondrial 54S ribosomal protein YmL35 [Vermiconidia calcicola]